MYSDNNKILFSEYCTLEEIKYCKQKLKAKLFSTFCKISKEGETYTLIYWYSLVPLSLEKKSFQLSISAVIKDKHKDTEDALRKIIPDMNKSVFSLFSSLFKFTKNHNKYIGDENMIIKCQKCGGVMPYNVGNEVTSLKVELNEKNIIISQKDSLIEQLQKDNERLMEIISKLETKPTEEAPVEEETTFTMAVDLTAPEEINFVNESEKIEGNETNV